MALENLTPVTRMEAILDGADITPVTREEYFWQQAATSGHELPDVTAADNGDVLTVVDGEWDKAAKISDFIPIVKEQIVTVSDTPQVVITAIGTFALDDLCILEVNGIKYALTASQLGPSVIGVEYTGTNEEYAIIIAESGGIIGATVFAAEDPNTSDPLPGTYVISLSKAPA